MKTDLFLNQILSFKSLAIGCIVAIILKFYLYSVVGFGEVWSTKDPSLWEQLRALLGYLWDDYSLPILAAAFILDYFLWPYFFRKEVQEIDEILAEEAC